jgi:GAF domain-containing protein
MRRSRRSTLRKNLRRLKLTAAPDAADESLAESGAVSQRLEAVAEATWPCPPHAPTAAPEHVLLRRLRFTADRLSQTKRGADIAAETLALAALFSGIGRGMVIRRVHNGQFAVGARREVSACTEAERKTMEVAAREVLRGRSIVDVDPRDARRPQILLALPLLHDGEVFGALVLHGPGRGRPLDASDRATLLGLARQAALALARLMANASDAATRAKSARLA